MDELRKRATTTHLKPPVYDVEEPLWTADDPVTGCVGVGYVEEEAFGNLVSVVSRYETEAGETSYRKLPGRTVRRIEGEEGLLDAVRRVLGRG